MNALGVPAQMTVISFTIIVQVPSCTCSEVCKHPKAISGSGFTPFCGGFDEGRREQRITVRQAIDFQGQATARITAARPRTLPGVERVIKMPSRNVLSKRASRCEE